MAILELATLKLKEGITREEANKRSQEIIQSTLLNLNGVLDIRSGFKVEDPSVMHWLIEWDSIEAHESFQSMTIFESFMSSLTYFSEPSYIHASVQVPSTSCVEWVAVHLKPETEKNEWVKGLDALKEALGERQISAGWVSENERAFVVLIGWESKEEHLEWKAGLTEQEVTRAMAMFRSGGVSKVELCHVQVE
ncbi:hypothetical protein BZA77DRAFT_299923 [Pyronema omphalodes]|nr:hypothetical protein BZA77DRAFT_299923 [Pyronema omphalodes]